MDKFRIDSHKLIYHPQIVSNWLERKDVYPIYIEISPSGACNQRCTFCALDFMQYKPKFLDKDLFKDRLSEMASLGVKSIMYAGEGEPLMHKDMGDIINYTKNAGIDVAITTNGVLFSQELLDSTLGNITWIKVSINGVNKETYKKIHRSSPGDFDRVIKNMSYAARIKKQKKYKCTLGMQLLLLPENSKEVVELAKIARDIGMDYLVVKPYTQHPLSKTDKYKEIKYAKFLNLKKDLDILNNDKFRVIFRVNAMRKWDKDNRNYRHCYALPFWCYIDSEGNVWGCSNFLKNKKFLYGNIHKNTFKEIWENPIRKKAVMMAEQKLSINDCRLNCRMDEVNRYLWELKHPIEHVNFI